MGAPRNYCRDCGRDVPTDSLTDLCAPCFSGSRAPVDVLALSRRVRNGFCTDCGRNYGDDVPDVCSDDCPGEEARAAVAELVEKVRAYEAASGKAATFGEVRDARREMFAALAKFGEG